MSLPPGEKAPALPSADLERVMLTVVQRPKLSVDVRDLVTSAKLTRSIDEASAIELSVLDAERSLLRSGRLNFAIDLEIDGLPFRLAHTGKSGDTLTLTFLDRGKVILGSYRTPFKVTRSQNFRLPQFAQALVRRSKRYPLGFYAPALSQRRALAAPDRAERDSLRQPGIASGVKLYGKDPRTPLNARQLRNAETALAIGEDLRASPLALRAAMVAGIVEAPNFDNPRSGDADSEGILQARVSIHGRELARSVEKSYRKFYTQGFWGKGGAIDLARKNPTRSAGWVAQQVQGSAHPERYDEYASQADAILKAYGGGAPDRSQYFASYEYMVGQPDGPRGESYWAALTRLAGEIGWRVFIVANTVFFLSEEDLFRGRPRALLTEDTPGVLGIDFDAETTPSMASQATVRMLADRWAAPPGSVVQLEAMGPADGRWIVTAIDRDLFDLEASVTLEKPAQELPEPRGESRTRQQSDTSADVTGVPASLAGSKVAQAYSKAVEIDRKQYAYVYGGGRSPIFQGPFDCSGFVSAVLNAAGLGITTVLDTVAFGSWGQAGKGRYLTVWVKPLPGRNGHMFIEFTIDGKSEFFESGGTRGAKTGRRPNGLSTTGYQARHWSGT